MKFLFLLIGFSFAQNHTLADIDDLLNEINVESADLIKQADIMNSYNAEKNETDNLNYQGEDWIEYGRQWQVLASKYAKMGNMWANVDWSG